MEIIWNIMFYSFTNSIWLLFFLLSFTISTAHALFFILKFAFKDASTKNSEPTYWTILFVMLNIYFILSSWKKIQKGYIKLNYVVCLSGTGSSCHVTVMGSLIVLVNKRADWNVPVSYIKYMSLCSALWFQH